MPRELHGSPYVAVARQLSRPRSAVHRDLRPFYWLHLMPIGMVVALRRFGLLIGPSLL